MVTENPALRDLLERWALSSRVVLAGPRADIAAVMNALDLHVLSSRSEAFPNVVAEAMACGTPCVVTDVGEAAEIVGDQGWCVPSGDPVALSGAMRAALLMLASGEAESLRAACRRRILETFNQDRMVTAYQDAWSRAIVSTATGFSVANRVDDRRCRLCRLWLTAGAADGRLPRGGRRQAGLRAGAAGHLDHPNFTFHKCDICDYPRPNPDPGIGTADGGIHLAAIVGDPACKREPELPTGKLGGLEKSDRACAARGVGSFALASTCSNYGKMPDPAHTSTSARRLPRCRFTRTQGAARTLPA